MTDGAPRSGPWWETTPDGAPILVGIVKVDRAGSTKEWDELPADVVRDRASRYGTGVEAIARAHGAAWPLHWQGDGVMLFVTGDAENSAAGRAFQLAERIWQRLRIELGLAARIAVHAARVTWSRDTGKIRDPALDLCGHLEHVAPENSIAVSEDVALELPEAVRDELGPLGVTTRDLNRAYVFPAKAAERGDPAKVVLDAEFDLRERLRRLAQSPLVRDLRFVGVRYTPGKPPPRVDVREVFVAPEFEIRAPRPAFAPEAHGDDDPKRRDMPWLRALRDDAASSVLPFAEALSRYRSLVVLGDPGSGKTTLLRWLAVAAAGGLFEFERRTGCAERLLPVLVSVGRLAEIRREGGKRTSVVVALGRYLHGLDVASDPAAISRFLETRLDAGDCLVLLDGLDESKDEERLGLRDWLESFCARYPKNRFVVSSRIHGFPGFTVPHGENVHIGPFGDEQVDRYITAFVAAYRKWEAGGPSPAEDAAEVERLRAALRDNPRLRALARNPFLLASLCLVHRAEGRLPRHRVQFYEIFSRTICESWSDARRIVAGDGGRAADYDEEAIPILGRLALRMHEEHPHGAAPRAFVVKVIADKLVELGRAKRAEARKAADEFLRRVTDDAPILFERGPGQWGFLHLTFQEFFVAAGLHAEERFEDVAFEHLFESRWQEVIRLGVGYMALVQKRHKAASEFVRRVLEWKEPAPNEWMTRDLSMNLPLAALVTADGGDAVDAGTRRRVARAFLDWVLPLMQFHEGLLAELGGTDYSRYLGAPLVARLSAGTVDARSRSDAAWALGAMKYTGAVRELLGVVRSAKQPSFLRGSAAMSLGEIGDRRAMTGLVEVSSSRPRSKDLRECLRSALDRLRSRSPEQPPARTESDSSRGEPLDLIARARDDSANWRSRRDAVFELGSRRERAALAVLLRLVLDASGDDEVRVFAVHALGQLGDARAIRPMLRLLSHPDRVTSSDKYAFIVRMAAISALGHLGAAEAIEPILDIARDASHGEWMQQEARLALWAIAASGSRLHAKRRRKALGRPGERAAGLHPAMSARSHRAHRKTSTGTSGSAARKRRP